MKTYCTKGKTMKTYYLIGNAHLDPVWMWDWTEGCAEARATVKSALDRLREYPDFVFTCAAAVLYQWIEAITPEMFEEVKARIREGRWRLAGGWWVQPDCNLPGGESFVRHGLYSQRYFMDRFGTTAKIGYNVDSFGHAGSLPQILKKSGLNAYVFMRPMKHEKELASNIFLWRSKDGTTIPAYRLSTAYCQNFTTEEELQNALAALDEESNPAFGERMLFYGVGNHGGGPTRRNLDLLLDRREKDPDNRYIFASPDDFFRDIDGRKEELPVLAEDLQHHASGCYSAYAPIKKRMRRSESALLEAEALSVVAEEKLNAPYPAEALREGWKKTLFVQFHDSLGGCCIEPAYKAMDEWADMAIALANDASNLARQRLAWNVNTERCPEGSDPVVAFNPLSWPVEAVLRVNRQSRGVYTAEGEPLGFQNVQSYTNACMGRADTLVKLTLPSMGWRLFYLERGEASSFVKTGGVTASDTALENEYLRAAFDPRTGDLISLFDKRRDCETLSGPACVPVLVDEKEHDTWSHGKNFFNRFIGRFEGGRPQVLEAGPLRAVIKVVSRYNRSEIRQYFTLHAGSDRLEVRVYLNWLEEHTALKLEIPCRVGTVRDAVYENPYSVIERPCDGEEEPTHRWMGIRGEAGSFAVLNDCKYSFSADGATIRLLAARGCIFGDHGRTRTAEDHFTDYGVQEFTYVLCPDGTLDAPRLSRLAAELNTPAGWLFESRHAGTLPEQADGIFCDRDNVIVSVLKPAEDGEGHILRAYEIAGMACEAAVSLPVLKEAPTLRLHFNPYEIRTVRIEGTSCREVMMTEFDIETER